MISGKNNLENLIKKYQKLVSETANDDKKELFKNVLKDLFNLESEIELEEDIRKIPDFY